MKMHRVESSQIEAMGYDEESQKLRIRFHPKGDEAPKVYEYSNITTAVYAKLTSAESIGRFFISDVRANPKAFPFRQIEEAI